MRAEMFNTLKTALKARGMTYTDLAKALGTSEPTVKRLFAARDAKLSRIVAICEVLGVPFEDIVAQAERADVPPARLNRRVEGQLARRPALFHLFVLLREGLSPAEAAAVLELDDGALFNMALDLERLELAEVQPGCRIRLAHRGPIAFDPQGPLHGMLKELNLRFVAETFSEARTQVSGFATISRQVSKRTAREVADELLALSRRLAEAARRDQATLPPEQLEACKLVTAWGPVSYGKLAARAQR